MGTTVLGTGAVAALIAAKSGESTGDAIWMGVLAGGGVLLLLTLISLLLAVPMIWDWWADRPALHRRSDVALIADSLKENPVSPPDVRAWLAARKRGLAEDDVLLWGTRGFPFTLADRARRAGVSITAVDAAVVALEDSGIWNDVPATPRRIASAFAHYEPDSFRDWTAFQPEDVTDAVRRQVSAIDKFTIERRAWALDRAHQGLSPIAPEETVMVSYPRRWAKHLEVLPNGTLRRLRSTVYNPAGEISLTECVSMTGGLDMGGTNRGYVALIARTGQQFDLTPHEVATTEFRRALRLFCPAADAADPDTGFTPLQLVDGPAARVDLRVSMITIDSLGMTVVGNAMVIDNRPTSAQADPDADTH